RSYGMALVGEATNLLRVPEWGHAETILRRALLLLRANLSADHGDVGFTEWKLGLALIGQRRFSEAEPHVVAGYEIMKKLGVPLTGPSWPMGSIVSYLSYTYEALGQYQQAARYRAELHALTLAEVDRRSP